MLQVYSVIERLEEHRETFLLVRLDDLDGRHAFEVNPVPDQTRSKQDGYSEKEIRNDASTHRLAAPGALLVLLARNEDIAELAQVPADLVRYEPEDARALTLLLVRDPRDGFGIIRWCRCVQSDKRL